MKKIKVWPLPRQMGYRAMTGAIWVVGLQSWWSVLEGYPVGATILLILAVTFTVMRDSAFPLEVRGFSRS